MPVWPFARRSGHDSRSREGGSGDMREVKRNFTPNDELRRTSSRRNGRRKRRSSESTASIRGREKEKMSLDLPPVNAPFAKQSLPPGSAENMTALPRSRGLDVSPHLRPASGNRNTYPYTDSNSSLPTARERGKLQPPQSLRGRRAATESVPPIRRKSTRRKKTDSARAEELRAMTMPLPKKRPASNLGGLFRRESKKAKNGHGSYFDKPDSNVSLPLADSIHSNMSSGSESRAYMVRALDMFSPRPKIRYSVGSPYDYSSTGHSPPHPARSSSRKERNVIPELEEADRRRRKKERIGDLADDMDAGSLREILERDKRRREKKRKAEEERVRRRLERRAQKQQVPDRAGTPPVPPQQSTGIVGLGIERDRPSPMEDVRPATPLRQVETGGQALHTPPEIPLVKDVPAIRSSRPGTPSPTPGHTREPSDISQMPELPSEAAARQAPAPVAGASIEDPRTSGSLHPIESVETVRTTPQKDGVRRRSSEGKRMLRWASIFRRGKRKSTDQIGISPSEQSFSNTSRESMARQPPPPHLVAAGPTPAVPVRRPGAPTRTMSKFKEDLPEYPLSPPDSRMQSPEAASSSQIAARRRSRPLSNIQVDANIPETDVASSTADNETRPSIRTDSPVSPGVTAAGLMSQSLASIDSEGSWLSGKPMKRRSNKSHVRSSGSSSNAAKPLEDFSASYEELGIPDDEYFRRLTPQVDDRRRSGQSSEMFGRKPSSTVIAAMATTAESEDEGSPVSDRVPIGEKRDSDENIVQESVERHPTVVHRQPRVKSTEGLLSYFKAEDAAADQDIVMPTAEDAEEEEASPTSYTEPVTLQRATSVDLGRHHARHLSAGSAKLLDIPPRRSSSVDPKRLSHSSQMATPNEE